MAENLPYLLSPGMLGNVFDRIKAAATPERFTGDFLSNTLGMKGGGPRVLVPFLKRIGFLRTDGAPTDLYRMFRNPQQSGQAVAQAMRIAYKPLYDMNEQVHVCTDAELRGLVVQCTGLEGDARVTQAIVGTFKAMKQRASFEQKLLTAEKPGTENGLAIPVRNHADSVPTTGVGVNLSYTINLNLPPSTDIAVFNAIFKALKENLLQP
jgi:hypothetical protein